MHSKSFLLSHQKLVSLLFIIVELTAIFVDGQLQPRFTKEPPSNLYVRTGENATFEWKYFVDNRNLKFDLFSPKWSFYYENGTEEVIGSDSKPEGWNFKTASKCPQRLLTPTLRVFRKENATLVITDVTTADNGEYGCTLVLASPPPEESKKVQLIVTVPPQINITGETNVTQNTNLTLICSAVGPPTPNVTWISKDGVVVRQGIQSATLFIANIKKEQNGTYFCNATNNPERDQQQKNVTVTVKFRPEKLPDGSRYKNNYKVCHCDMNKKVEIAYGATGYPPPTYYWYDPSNKSVGENKTGEESKITVKPIHGNWTCYITNGIGQGFYYRFEMEVLPDGHEDCEHCIVPEKCLSTEEIVGIVIGVLVGVGIIAVIGVVVYKKVKKDDKRISLKALVLIIVGVLVASGIIVAIILAILAGECIKAGLLVGITLGVVVGVGIIAVIGVIIYIKK